ncbi:glycine zipper family protein [Geomonas sp. RF6]|uniref:glycine zipper family protein n=1 Tax=Geomonas sp. RF6 TaxID=2897342 RepID=UPI001E295C12|nr:glycine zipper family protein [Geomonas sp. RF6]UFS70743.1 glycine zipper family protein [Geomonas sp. RF6]
MISALMLFAVGGCATLPSGPSVLVLPSEGKPFEQFQGEDAMCRDWAGGQVGISPQQASKESTINGAAIGTVLGAGIGAALGAAGGDPGAGAAFGAGTGLLFGTAAGADSAQTYGWQAQRRYDNAYLQCMYSYGNQIPSVAAKRRTVRAVPPPPPPPSYEDRY